MATIRERKAGDGSTRYAARIRIKGYPQQSATFRRKTDARRWVQQIEAAIREGRDFKSTEAKRRTAGQMIDRYVRDVLPTKPRNARYQKHQFAWWRDRIGDYSLADVSPAVIAECRDELLNGETQRNKKRSPSTVVRYLAAISHAFTVASKEWGWMDRNPVSMIRKPKENPGRVRFLSDSERVALLNACRESLCEELHDIVIIAITTGLRRGELLGLRWGNVDFQRVQLTVRESKNDETRTVPIAGPCLECLKLRSKIRRIDTDLVFPSPHMVGNNVKPLNVGPAFKRAVAEAGLVDLKFHDLRHTCASYLAMNGATSHEIAAVLGHKTLAMVKRYSHLSEQHTSGVVGRMVESIFGDSADAKGAGHE